MKKIVLCALLALVSAGAFAKPPSDDCITRSNIFELAANARDAGQSPQYALGVIQNLNLPPLIRSVDLTESKAKEVNNNMLKGMINVVYFERVNAFPGSFLSARIIHDCMNERPNFQPLK